MLIRAQRNLFKLIIVTYVRGTWTIHYDNDYITICQSYTHVSYTYEIMFPIQSSQITTKHLQMTHTL